MSIESRSRQYGKVFDHWQIKEFLGSGSGGKTAVFRLVRSDSGWGVSALKVINLIEERGDINALSDYRKREYEYAREECSKNAEQEVRLMDDLRGNTNIVDYLNHTFVDWSDDSGFGRDLLIRMELLKDLRSEIRNGKIFSEREVLKIGRDICVALIRCHRKNILHRDVKPENIFRNKDGDYKLGDFGVSRVLDACPGAVASTGIGTYEYWPAEQMTGRYDKRVDIYSLGLVLYELCNQNHLPFATSTYATSKEVSMRLAGEPLPSPSSASAMLARVILKACAFDPDERYQTAEELLKALNHVIRNIQETATPREIPQSQKSVPGRDNYATEAAGEANRFISQGKDNVYKTEYASADRNPRRGSFETKSTRGASYKTLPAEKVKQNKLSTKASSGKRKSLLMIYVAAVGMILLIGGMLGFLFFNNETEDASLTMAESTIESTAEDLPVDQSETSLVTEVGTTTGVVEAELLGVKYGVETTEIDLTMLTSDDVDAAIKELKLLPNLVYINLVDDENICELTKTDVKKIKDALPNVSLNYVFDFFGTTISTEDENVEIKSVFIGDENASEIRLALDLMNHCKRFVLDNCNVSYEVMAQIREDYRDRTKVVWSVRFGAGETLTDAEVIRAVYDLVDANCGNLIYCEDVVYLDISHNEYLTDIEFISGMPNLEVAIISGNPVKDLSAFSNCKELRVLEAAFCEYIENIQPLENCEKLEMLNISNTHALDLRPLDDLPLTLMCHRQNPSGKSRVPIEEQARFISQHPSCWTSFDGAQPYGEGWRYDSNNNPLDWYSNVRKIFKYDNGNNVPNHVGWYLDDTTTNDFDAHQFENSNHFVETSGGYKYTGKIIRANEVNVRANPSTSAEKTTSLKNGSALVIYETTVNEDMAWGRCDAGWVYLYYVDLTPVTNGAVDARVVYNDNTIIYTDVDYNGVAGTYSRMSVVDIYEISGKMARTELGWVNTDNLL